MSSFYTVLVGITTVKTLALQAHNSTQRTLHYILYLFLLWYTKSK